MGLAEQSILDAEQITGNVNDFGVYVNMQAPNGETAAFVVSRTKHHFGLNDNGQEIATKKASIRLSENLVLEANPNYPLRITDTASEHYGEVDLKDHLINVNDSTGIIKNYIAKTWLPDEFLGLIVVIMDDYQA